MSNEKIKVDKLGNDTFDVSGGKDKKPSGPIKRKDLRKEIRKRK